MRQFILFLFATCSVCCACAQRKVYCEIIEEIKSQKKTRIYLDYGQERKKNKDIRVKNEDGGAEVFSSRVEALNVMSALGWTFEQVYVKVSGSQSNGSGSISSTTHYLLSKEIQTIDELDDIMEKIKSKKEEMY